MKRCSNPETASPRESGSVTLWLVIMSVAMFAAIGLVSDGGQAMAAKGTAIGDAYEAARPAPKPSTTAASEPDKQTPPSTSAPPSAPPPPS